MYKIQWKENNNLCNNWYNWTANRDGNEVPNFSSKEDALEYLNEYKEKHFTATTFYFRLVEVSEVIVNTFNIALFVNREYQYKLV